MNDDWYDVDEDYRQELAAEALWERRHQARLRRHPDCRDPYHPGCAACCDEEDDA